MATGQPSLLVLLLWIFCFTLAHGAVYSSATHVLEPLGVRDLQTALCSVSNPCEKGCCSKHGFCGYGPEFCEKPGCQAKCEQKSECKAAGWPMGFSEIEKCPLNVCCSKHGFCGTGKEFCGDEVLNRPVCSGKNRKAFSRIVGYYEGWGPRRPCDRRFPEDIPQGVYTHLNFAFATIHPETFEIRPAHPDDVQLYERLTRLKESDPFLQVYIAIGDRHSMIRVQLTIYSQI